jgi:hypothetical protein
MSDSDNPQQPNPYGEQPTPYGEQPTAPYGQRPYGQPSGQQPSYGGQPGYGTQPSHGYGQQPDAGAKGIVGVLSLVIAPIVGFLYLRLFRMMCEFYLAITRMSEDINRRLPGR